MNTALESESPPSLIAARESQMVASQAGDQVERGVVSDLQLQQDIAAAAPSTPVAQAVPEGSHRHPSPRTPARSKGDCAPPIHIKLLQGGPVVMHCRWIKSTRSWRWQAGPRSLTCDSRHGPRAGLEQWLVQRGEAVTEESLLELRQALALMEPDIDATPPPQRTPRRQAAEAAESQWSQVDLRSTKLVVPSLETCNQILGMSASELLRFPVCTQRVLPNSVKDQVVSVLADLWRVLDDLTLDNQIREAARVMWALSPRWAWPQPERPEGGRLLPHARPRLIRKQLQKVCTGDWHGCLLIATPPEPCSSLRGWMLDCLLLDSSVTHKQG